MHLTFGRVRLNLVLYSGFHYDEAVGRRLYRALVSVLAFSLLSGITFAQELAQGPAASMPDCSVLAGQVFRCPKLGFTYKVLFGWVDRTEDMQGAARPTDPGGAGTERNNKHSQAPEPSGKTLLAVFERPPGTASDTLNSAVIIAIEARSSYPTIKTAADYFGPLGEIVEQRGLKMDGAPYSFAVGSKQVVRGDFTAGNDKSTVRQTSLVVLEKSYILSFTFLSGSDEEIDGLVENLSFASGPRRSSPR